MRNEGEPAYAVRSILSFTNDELLPCVEKYVFTAVQFVLSVDTSTTAESSEPKR